MKSFKVDSEDVGLRADVFIAQKYPMYARSALHKLFERGLVLIDSTKLKAGYKLKFGDSIVVDDTLLSDSTASIDLPIIYEDEDVIVIDKPVGVLSHSNGGLSNEASVASFIRSRINNSFQTGTERAGIVHRLDRATSGVMVCAKNPTSLSYLQKQFQNRKVQKTYLAITNNVPKLKDAIIDAPIGRDLKNPKTFTVKTNGKKSVTEYTLVKSNQNGSLLKLIPKTGRTHQIRVHLKYIGCPIVGDFLYGGSEASRLMLHAHTIELRLPSEQVKEFVSDVPDEFNEYLNATNQ